MIPVVTIGENSQRFRTSADDVRNQGTRNVLLAHRLRCTAAPINGAVVVWLVMVSDSSTTTVTLAALCCAVYRKHL